MANIKVCPIIASAGVIAQGASGGRAVLPDGWNGCVESVCAWYDASKECCSMLAISKNK